MLVHPDLDRLYRVPSAPGVQDVRLGRIERYNSRSGLSRKQARSFRKGLDMSILPTRPAGHCRASLLSGRGIFLPTSHFSQFELCHIERESYGVRSQAGHDGVSAAGSSNSGERGNELAENR